MRRHHVLLVVVLGGVVAALVWVAAMIVRDRTLPPREDPAAGRREVIEAFRPGSGVEVPPDLQRFFDDFGATLRAGGTDGQRFWDVRRFAREVDRDGAMTRAGIRPDNPSLLEGMRTGLTRMSANLAVTVAYDRTEVRSVRWLVPGKEAVVVARHTARDMGETVRFKMRWWLTYDAGWRLYDFEDAAFGGRATVAGGATIAELVTRGPGAAPAIQAAFAPFYDAQRAIVAGEFDKADRLLADPALARLPRVVQPILAVWRAAAATNLGRPAEALGLLDVAERDLPDAPIIFLLRAASHAQTEEWDKVLAAGRKYEELIGPDEVICQHLGNALLALERPAEAAAEYRRALDDAPDSADALTGLVGCKGHVTKAEAADRYARFPDPAPHLANLVGQAGDDTDLAEALTGVVRERAPNHPEGLFQAAALRLRKDDWPGAMPLFLKAVEHAGEQGENYRFRFASVAVTRGKAVEAYAALPDKDAEAGFKALAGALRDELDVDEEHDGKALEDLLAAHRRRKPQDVWLTYYEGVLHHARGAHDAAEKALAAGMGRAADEEARDQFRWLRVDNLADGKRLFHAYLTVGPRRDTFGQLASRLHADADLPVLAALVWLHGWADPGDPALPLWRGEVAFRGQEYAAAVTDLKIYRAAAGEDGRRNEWRVRDRLVRSLLRLNRPAEARAELRPADGKGYYDRVLDAAITAAAGDVDQTEKELDELVRTEGATAAWFHADPDLSRLLQTLPFRRLLEKYPPPPPGPGLKKV